MATVSKTPSPRTFAEGWTQKFAEVVREGAGRDGRLSLTEARRIGDRLDGGKLFSDNAVNYLLATGQKTVSAEKLITVARVYAEREAARAAGPDGRLSAADGRKLPQDLAPDLLYLQGKGPVDPPVVGPEQLRRNLSDMVLEALDNGTARKLPGPPPAVRGRKPVIERLAHPASQTSVRVVAASDDVYLSRAANRPTPLVGWYQVGKLPPADGARAALRGAVDAATKDLSLTSESDAHVRFVRASDIGSAPITEALVRRQLGQAHDLLSQSIFLGSQPQAPALADRDGREEDAQAWLARRATVFDPADTVSVEQAKRWRALGDVLKANLTDLKLFRFGEPQVSLFLVGRTKQGDLAGIYTAAVET